MLIAAATNGGRKLLILGLDEENVCRCEGNLDGGSLVAEPEVVLA